MQSRAQWPSMPQLKQRPDPGGGPLPKSSRDPRGPCYMSKQQKRKKKKLNKILYIEPSLTQNKKE